MPFPPEGMCSPSAKKILFFAPDTVQEQYQWVTDSGTNLKYPRRLYEHINPEKEKSLRCWNVSKESCLPSQNRWTVHQEIYLCRKFASRPHQNKPADKWMSKSIHAEEDFKDTPETRLPILPVRQQKRQVSCLEVRLWLFFIVFLTWKYFKKIIFDINAPKWFENTKKKILI
jgi:hypothetical protein